MHVRCDHIRPARHMCDVQLRRHKCFAAGGGVDRCGVPPTHIPCSSSADPHPVLLLHGVPPPLTHGLPACHCMHLAARSTRPSPLACNLVGGHGRAHAHGDILGIPIDTPYIAVVVGSTADALMYAAACAVHLQAPCSRLLDAWMGGLSATAAKRGSVRPAVGPYAPFGQRSHRPAGDGNVASLPRDTHATQEVSHDAHLPMVDSCTYDPQSP